MVSIDNHMMEVVEADDTPVHGPNVTHVQIGPAQRYSVVVNTDQGKAGQGFWMRTGTDTGTSPLPVLTRGADRQDVSEMGRLQSVISSFSDMSTRDQRVMDRGRPRFLGENH